MLDDYIQAFNDLKNLRYETWHRCFSFLRIISSLSGLPEIIHTNTFSKKVENLEYSLALHYMYYNFARVHRTLGVTPAMAAGVADHMWTLEEIIDLVN